MRKLSFWPLHGKAPKEPFGLAATFKAKRSLKSDFSGLEVGFSTSGGEFVSERAHGADVFKAVN
jgi:hypothetical protein